MTDGGEGGFLGVGDGLVLGAQVGDLGLDGTQLGGALRLRALGLALGGGVDGDRDLLLEGALDLLYRVALLANHAGGLGDDLLGRLGIEALAAHALDREEHRQLVPVVAHRARRQREHLGNLFDCQQSFV